MQGCDETAAPRLCNLDDNGTPENLFDDHRECFTTDEAYTNYDLNSFEIDKNDDLWLATNNGLTYLHREL
jgi:hypothetical protein